MPRVRRGGDYHKSRHILICHTCDAERACPPACPGCGAHGLALRRHRHRAARARDPARRFPTSSSRRMDSDTMRSPGSHEQVLSGVQGRRGPDPAGHADDRQGAGLPQRDAGGGGQRRHGAAPAGFPGRRADLPARGAGGRTHRAGRSARPGARADLLAGPPRDPLGDHGTTTRGSRGASCPSGKNTACRRSAGSVRLIARGPEESAVSAYMKDLAAAFRAGGRPVRPHPRPGPGPDPQDPQPLSVPPPVALPQLAAASVAGEHGARPAPRPARHRAGDRRRPDHHAVNDCVLRIARSQRNREIPSKNPKVRFTTFAHRVIFPAVRSHPGFATTELMVEFRPCWARRLRLRSSFLGLHLLTLRVATRRVRPLRGPRP